MGAAETLADALDVTELGARIVLAGMHDPRPPLPAYAVSTAERTITGSFCYTASEFAQTTRWAAETDLDLSVLIEGRVGLGGAPAGFTALARGEDQASKVLVYPHGVDEDETRDDNAGEEAPR